MDTSFPTPVYATNKRASTMQNFETQQLEYVHVPPSPVIR